MHISVNGIFSDAKYIRRKIIVFVIWKIFKSIDFPIDSSIMTSIASQHQTEGIFL